MKTIIAKILRLIAFFDNVYFACRKVVDYHDNLNNCELTTNGELAFIESHIKYFDVIFDVGANVGEWSDLVIKLKPAAKVYAFEPVKNTFDLLDARKSNNLQCENLALGDMVGSVDFTTFEDDSTLNGINSRSLESVPNSKIEKVSMTTLDQYCKDNGIAKIDFLKIDTEGNELAVLNGAVEMMSAKAIKAIQFEYGGTYIDSRILLKDIYKLLVSKGYSIYKVMPNNLKPMHQYNHCQEDFQYSNYVALLGEPTDW